MAKILVIDDDPFMLRLVSQSLNGAEHETIICDDPTEVMSLATRHKVDAIVLDVVMPNRSGFEVLTELRSAPETSDIPVLMLSSLGTGEDRVRGLRFGADDYLPKPFERDELVLRMNRLTSSGRDGPSSLSGNLEDFTTAELLHTLHRSGKSGTLILEVNQTRGRVALQAGLVAKAIWEGLQGFDALLEIIFQDRGRFRFETQDPGVADSAEGLLNIESVLLNAAWIDDELSHVERFDLSTAWLPVIGNRPIDVRTHGPSLPLTKVYEAVEADPGTTALKLVSEGVAATGRTELSLFKLCEQGLVEPVSGKKPKAIPPDTVAPDQRLVAVAGTLVRSAVAMGHSSELVHLLIVWSPTNATSRVATELIRGMECLDDLRERIPHASSVVERGGGCSLPIRGPAGNLLVHLHPLDQAAYRNRALALRSTSVCTIALLENTAQIASLGWLFEPEGPDRAEEHGLAIVLDSANGSSQYEALDHRPEWQMSSGAPESMVDVLVRTVASLLNSMNARSRTPS